MTLKGITWSILMTLLNHLFGFFLALVPPLLLAAWVTKVNIGNDRSAKSGSGSGGHSDDTAGDGGGGE
jgi:hypothetical protein